MEYPIIAAEASNELYRRQLHDYERPIALMLLQNAEVNRDKKKKRKPYELNDFCFYVDKETLNLPAARYGAAGLELQRRGLLPLWALFVYPELKKNASDATLPEPLALIGEWAILLAPICEDGECSGMLIASHECSGSLQELSTLSGEKVTLRMPIFKESVYAWEDASLPVR